MIRYLLLIFVIINEVCSVDVDGSLQIRMLHNINCNDERFCNRGTISVKSIRMGTSVVDQATFSNNDLQSLKELADVDGFYIVKSIVTSANNREEEFISSMKASAYLDSGLNDVINVWVIHTGAVVSVSFQVANSSNPVADLQEEQKLSTNFYLRHVDQAPIPDTASYIQKLEKEREAREKGEVKDNRSFIAKYWMYMVPVVLLAMVSGGANPDPAPASR